MDKKVVLITGALTGIGRATAIAFARAGHQVVVSGRNEETGQALAIELGAEAEFVRADVRFEDDVRAMIERAFERFGRLDVAVNNAGSEGSFGPIIDQTPESYAAVFDSNVLGMLLCLKHEMRVMQAQGSGSIVNISSTRGHKGAANGAIYVASKHAVEGLTRSAALEGGPHGVRVNALAPGAIDTEMFERFTGGDDGVRIALDAKIPLGRVGRPKEMAATILYLASEAASYVTGQILTADGGINVG